MRNKLRTLMFPIVSNARFSNSRNLLGSERSGSLVVGCIAVGSHEENNVDTGRVASRAATEQQH